MNDEEFFELTREEAGKVTFGGNNKGKIMGHGTIGKESSNSIENVLLVEGLNYNLLSISQLCDKGNKVIFETAKCEVIDAKTNEVKFEGQRLNNLYIIDLKNTENRNLCLVANKSNPAWLWHRRLGHASFSVLRKLSQLQLVKGLPNLKFQDEGICGDCVLGK